VRERFDSAFDGHRISDRGWDNLDAERRPRDLRTPHEIIVGGCSRSSDESDARQVGRDLHKHRQPLSGDAYLVHHQAGDIAAWPRKACNKT
jgi:hypothetical protein